MALEIDNCLIQQGSGTNEIYASCCCTFQCFITNTGDATTLIGDLYQFSFEQFIIKDFQINGNPASYPFFFDKGSTISLEFQVCAATDVSITDSLFIRFYDTTGTAATYLFDFISIDLSTSIDLSSIDFNSVPIGSSASVPVTIYNPTVCCYSYDIISDCAEVQPDNSTTNKLCNTDSQIINIVYTPTVEGDIACTLTFANECQSLNIPITGSAIAPETNSSSNGQKNKVDQTSVLPACSPRTINNQCNTGQAARGAIASRAQTITRPSGGAGRGKGFSK